MQSRCCRTGGAHQSASLCSLAGPPQQLRFRPANMPTIQRAASPVASAVVRSRRALNCLARRTKSGGGDRDVKQTTNASNNSTASSRTTSPPPSKSSQSNRSSTPSRNSKQQVSQLEAFVRNTPVLNRFLDGTLILGDAVMLVATEASSERLPVEQIPALAAVAVSSWIIAGAILGDYTMEPGQYNHTVPARPPHCCPANWSRKSTLLTLIATISEQPTAATAHDSSALRSSMTVTAEW